MQLRFGRQPTSLCCVTAQGAVPAGLGGQPGWESNVHGAQAYQAQHDLVTGVAACHALDAHKAGTLGFSFSGEHGGDFGA